MLKKEVLFGFIAGFCFAFILLSLYQQFITYTIDTVGQAQQDVTEQTSLELEHADTPEISDEQQEAAAEITKERLEYTVNSGDSLTSIWQNFDLPVSSAIKAAEAFKNADVSINQIIRAKDSLEIELENNQIIRLVKELNEGDKIILSYLPESDEYFVEKISPEVVINEIMVSAEVDGSIAATAESIGVSYNIIDEFADIFSSKVEFTRDIHPGDTFKIIYDQRKLADGKQLKPGKLRASELISQGKTYRVVNIPDDEGKNKYYDQHGVAMGNFFLRYPLKFTRISSVFSNNRFHPVHKKRRPHNGTDFAAPTGTPVRAVADAKVIAATYHRANGNWVKLQHSKRYATAYLHLSKIAKGIKTGGKVSRGTVIGYVGSTGYSTGPHLHYSFYDNGKYVDPLKVELPVLDHNKIDTNNPTLIKYLKKLDQGAQ